MKKKGKIIGVDMDDVLIEFNKHFCLYHNRLYGTTLEKKDIFSFDLTEVWQAPREVIVDRVLNFINSTDHDNALPVAGAIDAIKKLSKDNTLIVVTSRADELKEVTLKWLDTHFTGLFSQVVFTNSFPGNGKKKKKSEACKECSIEIFIDDAPEHIRDISTNGVHSLLLDNPWNQHELPPNVKRVYSWDEIVQYIASDK
ncbi:MAG: hypothetical protein PHG25_03785 [Candidatus Pacebacteria bacterium]|nr:hypothetical protein [Candidatus Paceibacterota bacterium]